MHNAQSGGEDVKNRSPYAVRTATQRYTTAIIKWLTSKYIESCSMIDKRTEGQKVIFFDIKTRRT